MIYEWRKQSMYRTVSSKWARGFARWLEGQGWIVGKITQHGAGAFHIPAIRVIHGS
jgi:hypothetical protein